MSFAAPILLRIGEAALGGAIGAGAISGGIASVLTPIVGAGIATGIGVTVGNVLAPEPGHGLIVDDAGAVIVNGAKYYVEQAGNLFKITTWAGQAIITEITNVPPNPDKPNTIPVTAHKMTDVELFDYWFNKAWQPATIPDAQEAPPGTTTGSIFDPFGWYDWAKGKPPSTTPNPTPINPPGGTQTPDWYAIFGYPRPINTPPGSTPGTGGGGQIEECPPGHHKNALGQCVADTPGSEPGPGGGAVGGGLGAGLLRLLWLALLIGLAAADEQSKKRHRNDNN